MNKLPRFCGQVVSGNHFGETRLNAPTANIALEAGAPVPPLGVYVSKVTIGGASHWGVTNIGKKPTLKGDHPVNIETYIFGINENLYGQHIQVELLTFLREEKEFASLAALRVQIEKDKAAAMLHIQTQLSGRPQA